ncbi:hypothetical protein Tco_1371925 [Tanacetum coccineum]
MSSVFLLSSPLLIHEAVGSRSLLNHSGYQQPDLVVELDAFMLTGLQLAEGTRYNIVLIKWHNGLCLRWHHVMDMAEKKASQGHCPAFHRCKPAYDVNMWNEALRGMVLRITDWPQVIYVLLSRENVGDGVGIENVGDGIGEVIVKFYKRE